MRGLLDLLPACTASGTEVDANGILEISIEVEQNFLS